MTARVQRIAALTLVGAGLVIAIVGASFGKPLRAYLDEEFRRTGVGAGGEQLYASSRPASETVGQIADAYAPADRRVAPEGVFLRYRDDYVRVTPMGSGSQVGVLDEDRGYAIYYPYVGGYWGTYSGQGEAFRGGGPGSGK